MEKKSIIVLSLTSLLFVVFVIVGTVQCILTNQNTCSSVISGFCPGVWAPFVFVSLPCAYMFGQERHNVWKYGKITVFACQPISILALVFSSVDAICAENVNNKGEIGSTRINIARIVAMFNSLFAVTLSIAVIIYCTWFVFCEVPKRLVGEEEGVLV